jgi:O-antigen ligase
MRDPGVAMAGADVRGVAGRADERPPPYVPSLLIVGGVLLLAIAAGRFVSGGRLPLGVALVLAAAFFLVVFIDISLAIAAWIVVLYIASLPALSIGPSVIGILLLAAWVGTGGLRRGRLPVLSSHRSLVVAMAVFASWVTLSIAWATSGRQALYEAGDLWSALLALVVVATILARPKDVVRVSLAFVGGAVLAVTLGFLGVGQTVNSADAAGRLAAAGDPNYQAAAFLAAMFMAGGLLSVFRSPGARVALAAALAYIAVGFFATESRGGLLALGFALVVALALFPSQRRQIATLLVVGTAAVAVWLHVRPETLHRLTTFGGGGSGREDVWSVAWRMFANHPLVGVGIGNFRTLEPRYALTSGPLTHVTYISETPKVAHNAYLGLLAETGVIGCVAFLAIAWISLRACWRAARAFDRMGAVGLGNLARAVLIATVGMLAAMFFISDPYDLRLWVLLALGPVLHTLARRGAAGATLGS